jgi:clan AA aspartic protease
MILGKIVNDRATIPVKFCLTEEAELVIDFVVDTGFNDYLTLPPQAIAAMNLPLDSAGFIRLADGSRSLTSLYSARINWDGNQRSVLVLATGNKPLVGTRLLQGFQMTIDFIPDGSVRLEQLRT